MSEFGIHPDVQTKSRLPRYPRIFATVTAVLTGMGIIPAIAMPVIVALVAFPNLQQQSSSQEGLTALDFASAFGILGLLVGYAFFFVVFFVSSIGFLRLRRAALSPYRACIYVYITLCVLASAVVFVPPILFRAFSPEAAALTAAAVLSFEVAVVWLCIRMLGWLRRPALLQHFQDNGHA